MTQQIEWVVSCTNATTGETYKHGYRENGAREVDSDGNLVFNKLEDATKAAASHVRTGMKVSVTSRPKADDKKYKIMGYNPNPRDNRAGSQLYRSYSFPNSYTLEEAKRLCDEKNAKTEYGAKDYRKVVYFPAVKAENDGDKNRIY